MPLCKSIESAIQWFQIDHGITFVTIHNPAVYLSGARVSISPTLVPRLLMKNFYIYNEDKENPSLVFSGDREIPTRGSTVPVGNEASPSFPLERWTRGLGFPGSIVHQ